MHYDSVSVRCPADLPAYALERAQEMAREAYKALGVRDLGRIDFRVADDGQVYFIEINALPSLEPGAGIYAAAALEGLHTDAVLGKVVESAVARWGLKDPRKSRNKPPRKGPLRVGFAYNVKRVKPALDGTRDEEAEYDAPATIQAVREAIAAAGHEVVDLEATADLPLGLETTKPDLVFNMAEGIKGRNRESQVPALLNCSTSPTAAPIPRRWHRARQGAGEEDRPPARHPHAQLLTMTTGKERLPKDFKFPLIVKPVAEGSSKGVHATSVVENEAELREAAQKMVAKYQQPALVEDYIGGREFTVGMLGERRPKVLPPMEVVFLDTEEKRPVYSFEFKQDWSSHPLRRAGDSWSRRSRRRWSGGARVLHRARLPRRGPGGLPHGRAGEDLLPRVQPAARAHAGMERPGAHRQGGGHRYDALIGEILSGAFRRYKERERERRDEAREPEPAKPVNGNGAVSLPPPVEQLSESGK